MCCTQAMVDVVSSQGWLTPALAAMDLSQMVIQALWDRDSILMQLPHLNKDTAVKCTEAEVESVFDLIDMKVGAAVVLCRGCGKAWLQGAMAVSLAVSCCLIIPRL